MIAFIHEILKVKTIVTGHRRQIGVCQGLVFRAGMMAKWPKGIF